MNWLFRLCKARNSTMADDRASEQLLPPVEKLESRLCLGSMHGAGVADWKEDQPVDLYETMEVFDEELLDDQSENLPTNQSEAEPVPASEVEPSNSYSSLPPQPPDTTAGSTDLTSPELSSALEDAPPDRLAASTADADRDSDPIVTATPLAAVPESEGEAAASGSAAPTSDAAISDGSQASSSQPWNAETLGALGLMLDGRGDALGLADSDTAVASGYEAWWTSNDEPVVIRYDFRDQNGVANVITDQQQALAVQGMQQWSDATDGHIVFERDTEAPISQIINIGTGDLAAFGHTSGVGGVLGVGGGRVGLNDEGHIVVSGAAWLDHAETWDTTIGNGNPSETADYWTVVSHEIGHTLGYRDSSGLNHGDMMVGTYTGERLPTAIDYAVEHGDFYLTLDTDAGQGFQTLAMTAAAAQLMPADVEQLLKRGAAASSSNDAIIAVVDRNGRVLGVRVESDVLTAIPDTDTLVFAIDGAIAKARTAALFSNGDPENGTLAPLTSRTVRFISQSTVTQREVESNPNHDGTNAATAANSTTRGPGFVAPIGVGGHFPPDIPFTPLVDLFAIEHTNRDSNEHPGADGIRGTADDFRLRTDMNADPALELGRFNIDPNFVPAGQGLYAPESWGHLQNSGDLPSAQSRGIATLPGGIPIFRDTNADGVGDTLVGGIGVFFPGSDGFATHEQGFIPGVGQTTAERTNAARVLESEYIAFAAVGGSQTAKMDGVSGAEIGALNGIAAIPDIDLPFGRLDLVGVTLEVFGPVAGKEGVAELIDVGSDVGVGDPNSGADQAFANGDFSRAGEVVPEGWLVAPHASTVDPQLTAANVQQIIEQGILAAEEVRAAVRLPLSSRTRMVFAVTDTTGEVLGLFRMQDATTFSIDVAVAKARNVAYYADATALQPVDQIVEPGTAFTNRTFRFMAQPRFPSGIDGTSPAPFSILNDDSIDNLTAENTGGPATVSEFNSVLGHDAFFPMTNFRDPGDPSVDAAAGAEPLANQNGIVFFPGSAPLYLNGALIGGFGVSGDGVDQDDVVTSVGATGFTPGGNNVLRADQTSFKDVRLPYQHFLRNPWG